MTTEDTDLRALISAATENDLDRLQKELDKWLHSSNTASPTFSPAAGTPGQPTLSLQPALHSAARKNHAQIVKCLIEKGFAIDPATVVAATAGHAIQVFEVLLEYGWDINLSLGHIGDALILAVGADNTTLVQFLIAHGADPNKNLRGESRTPLECGAYSASIPTLALLLDTGAQKKTRSPLVIAAREGRADIVTYLLDRGVDVNEIPDNDDIYDNDRQHGLKNALCTAALEGKAEIVKLLLERGADRDIRDTLGKSALDLAVTNDHKECIEMLSEGQ